MFSLCIFVSFYLFYAFTVMHTALQMEKKKTKQAAPLEESQVNWGLSDCCIQSSDFQEAALVFVDLF